MLSQQSEIGNILILQAIRLPFTQYLLGLVPNHTYRRNRKASPSNQAMDFEYRVFCTAQLLYLLVQRSNQNYALIVIFLTTLILAKFLTTIIYQENMHKKALKYEECITGNGLAVWQNVSHSQCQFLFAVKLWPK